MADYKKMYFSLAAKVADAVDILIQAQQEGERLFVEDTGRPPITLSGATDKTGGDDESGENPPDEP